MYQSEDEERRFVLRLFDYWHLLRAEQNLPCRTDLNFNDFGKDAASCLLLDLTPGLHAARLLRVGLRLKPDDWDSAEGRSIADCPQDSLMFELLRHLPETVERGVPVSKGGAFILRGRPALGRSILLPLSDDGHRITHVLAGINFKFTPASVAALAGDAAA